MSTEITFEGAIDNALKGRIQRRGTNKNYFFRIVGTDNDYYNNLRTLISESKKEKSIVIFEKDIIDENQTGDYNELFNLLRTEISKELFEAKTGKQKMKDLSNADITICSDDDVNSMFRKALNRVVNIAFKLEQFTIPSQQEKFTLDLIIKFYMSIVLKQPELLLAGRHEVPKCLYYGKIKRNDIYFLLLLHFFDFDVFYINPRSDAISLIIEQALDDSYIYKGKRTENIDTLQDKLNK